MRAAAFMEPGRIELVDNQRDGVIKVAITP
jgi:hypothetical protein